MELKLFIVIFAVFVQVSIAQDEANKDINMEELQEKMKEQLVNVKRAIKDKCANVSGSETTYDDVEKGAYKLLECLKGLIDFTEFHNEIEEAKPTGDLDLVFNRYCRKRSTLLECTNTFSNTIDPCFDEEEKKSKQDAMNIFNNLLNFICYKDGDQIALFIAEKGPECFKEKMEGLRNCFNETFSPLVKSLNPDTATIPKLVMGRKQCGEMDKLQVCMVRVLEGCEETTPANLVGSMFRFIKKGSICAKKSKRSVLY